MSEGIIKGIACLIILLYLLSLLTGGYVLLFGSIAEAYAKYPVVVSVLLTIFVLSILLIVPAYVYDFGAMLLLLLILALSIILPIVYYSTKPHGGAIVANYVTRISKPISVMMTRIVPLETAYAYAISLLQIPTHTIYMNTSYLYYINDTAIYCMTVEPEGIWNALKRNGKGIMLINGSNYPPSVKFVKHELYWSLARMRFKVFYFDSLERQLKLKVLSYKPLFEDSIEVYIDGKVYILIPIVRWARGFSGFSYSVPVLYGYAVVDEDGNIDIVRANKLGENRVTRKVFYDYKAPIVPEIVARQWVDLLRWSVGFIDVVIYHRTFEIRDIGKNPQPYLMYDRRGNLYWVFVAEPCGKSYAIKYIIYVDALSIEPRILIYEPSKLWIGASKVLTYVQKVHPTYDWDKFRLAEPIPIILNGTLYWKVTIITTDGRGVISIDLVNAETGVVHSLPVGTELTKGEFNAFVNALSVNVTTPEPEKETTLDKIREIKQTIKSLISALQHLLKELEELEEEVKSKS